MAGMNIKIVSINCNGLNTSHRVNIIENELESIKPDIFILKETHLHNLTYGK